YLFKNLAILVAKVFTYITKSKTNANTNIPDINGFENFESINNLTSPLNRDNKVVSSIFEDNHQTHKKDIFRDVLDN
ncbi:hypothetical protein, partial [Francisella tularensis]|uniref:hypothetical protein n=1 Tax=Francisella tularensis TaxID=263 RepID=UPI002381946E